MTQSTKSRKAGMGSTSQDFINNSYNIATKITARNMPKITLAARKFWFISKRLPIETFEKPRLGQILSVSSKLSLSYI
jgi:hypothetical protein